MPPITRQKQFDFDVSGRPRLPRLAGLFVTGTDTGVGKTLIAGAIAKYLRGRGRAVEVFKPAATGCRRKREMLVSADAEFLAACADSRRPLAEITPVRYTTPAAPNVAAERERRPVDLDAIFQSYARLENACEAVIVEGVGGLLCPISDDFWVIHLARMMHLPMIVVAHSGLGAINHTLLTLHAARSAGLEVAGVVINRYQIDPVASKAPGGGESPPPAPMSPEGGHAQADAAVCANPAQIAQRGGVQVLAIVPDEPANSVEKATIGPDTRFAIGQVDWEKVVFQQ